jgi:hypothetical protein
MSEEEAKELTEKAHMVSLKEIVSEKLYITDDGIEIYGRVLKPTDVIVVQE